LWWKCGKSTTRGKATSPNHRYEIGKIRQTTFVSQSWDIISPSAVVARAALAAAKVQDRQIRLTPLLEHP